jgi:beta-glucosidase
MTLDEKLDYIGGTGFAVRAVPSQHLPAFEMSDGPYGTRSNAGFPSTTYAAGIGLAASWDPELAARVGGGIGRDARARGVHYMLGPGVNIYRSPRNGRNFEYFGEDPFLSGKIAVGYITGMQEQGVSATVKHYLGNNSEYLRHDSDTNIDERTVREIYLPAFEAAVKKGQVGAVMDSYNLIDGKHATQNGYFNIDVLRKDWKFDGVLMSDWDATYDAIGAANGGLDIEMPTGKFMNRANLEAAVKSGTVTEATIDEKIRHLLTTAVAFGWLDRPQTDPMISYVDARNQAAALDSARESAVLLKNEGGLLPLDKSQVKTILVVGPDAYPGVPVGGGSAGVVPFHMVSPLEGISSAFTGVNVLYDRGIPTLSELARRTAFTTADGKPGVTLELFDNSDLSGAPSKTSTVSSINAAGMSWSSFGDDVAAMMALFQAGDKHLSHRYTGTYTAANAGKYIVALEGAGEGSGNRVYLDGKMIIDDWDLVRAFQPQLSVELSAGPHKVVVEDKQNGPIGGHLRFAVVSPDAVVNPRAIELASKADVVIVEAGFESNSEGEGGDRTFALPYGEDQLIEAMTTANKKTIVTITAGGNVDSSAWIEPVPALLQTWYAGQEAGHALADILDGDVNPSGHLPATFERRAEDNPTYANYYPAPGSKEVYYKEGIFVGYRGYEKNHIKPLFPFGYGLSYTTFKFGKVTVTPEGAGATVTFDVTNSGKVKGAEVAQVYVSDTHSKTPRPARELKGFERVELAPGETKNVSIKLDARAFAFYDVAAKKWVIDPGRFVVHVGDSVESTPEEASVEISREAAAGAF